jgi:hypothetical protein
MFHEYRSRWGSDIRVDTHGLIASSMPDPDRSRIRTVKHDI